MSTASVSPENDEKHVNSFSEVSSTLDKETYQGENDITYVQKHGHSS
jgi:hypothetical protein